MNLKHKVIAVIASVILVSTHSSTAYAGNGNGAIYNESWSVQCTKGSLDYLGRWGHYSVCPGQKIGGTGWDMDAVWIPPRKYVRVMGPWTPLAYYDNRGSDQGYWKKLSDGVNRIVISN